MEVDVRGPALEGGHELVLDAPAPIKQQKRVAWQQLLAGPAAGGMVASAGNLHQTADLLPIHRRCIMVCPP